MKFQRKPHFKSVTKVSQCDKYLSHPQNFPKISVSKVSQMSQKCHTFLQLFDTKFHNFLSHKPAFDTTIRQFFDPFVDF